MSENMPTGQPDKKPGARKATKATKATSAAKVAKPVATAKVAKATQPAKAASDPTRKNTNRKRILLGATAALAVLITGTLTLALRDPSDLGPLDATIKTDPTIGPADRILIDQDNDGTPDTVLDLNDNNRADKGEPSLAELAHQRTTLVNDIAANPATIHESLITPPGDDWWDFTTSQAADLLLWETDTPTDANWYGVTTGRATKPNAPWPTYHAVHIGFPNADTAKTYMEYVGLTTGPAIRAALRGTVITLTSPHVDPYAEPFPKTGKTLDATNAALHPTAASWTLNLGQQHTDLADSAKKKAWGTALDTYYTSLGYTPDTIWNGVATTPEGPWIGTLADYNPDAINLDAASAAIASTQNFTCNDNVCFDTGNSLTSLGLYATNATANTAIGGAGTGEAPTYAPTGTLLAFTVNNTAVRGIVEGNYIVPRGPYSVIHGAITNGVRNQPILTLTIPATEDTTKVQNEPTGPVTGGPIPGGGKDDKGTKDDNPNTPQPGDPVATTKPPKNGDNLPTPVVPTDPSQQ